MRATELAMRHQLICQKLYDFSKEIEYLKNERARVEAQIAEIRNAGLTKIKQSCGLDNNTTTIIYENRVKLAEILKDME